MREKVKHTLSANRHLFVFFFCLAARVPLLCGLNFVCVCFGWTSAAARCCCPLLLSVFCVLLFCCGWYGPTELRLGSLAMSKHHRPHTISLNWIPTNMHIHTTIPSAPQCVLPSLFGAVRGSARHLGDSSVSTTLAIERDTLIYLACIRIISNVLVRAERTRLSVALHC